MRHMFATMTSAIRRRIDWWLIIATIGIVTVGYIMIFSTTSFKGLSEFDDPYFFIKRHSLFLCIGLMLFGVGMRLPIDFYKKYAIWGYSASIILLILTFISGWGVELGGSNRWVSLWKIQFQPVEIVKFWWSVAVSLVISNKRCQLSSFRQGIVPLFIVMLLPIIFLMMQPDLGNTVLIAMVGFSLMLLSNIRLWILGTATAIGTMVVSVSIAVYPYQLKRIESFLHPWQDPLGANYHIIQSFTAIGSGGIFGFGIGESRLKYFYLPLHYSDFIFSILCEEGGFFLAIIVVMLFCVIFFRKNTERKSL